MFDALGGRLGDVFDRLRKRGALSESDVSAAMRDIRVSSRLSSQRASALR